MHQVKTEKQPLILSYVFFLFVVFSFYLKRFSFLLFLIYFYNATFQSQCTLLHEIKYWKWVNRQNVSERASKTERSLSLKVLFFRFLVKRPNDVTIFVLKMRNIAGQHLSCCGLIWESLCSSSSLDRSARSVILQPVERTAGSRIYAMGSKKERQWAHHRGASCQLIGGAEWTQQVSNLWHLPLKKKCVQHGNTDIQEIKWTSKGCDLWKCQTVG